MADEAERHAQQGWDIVIPNDRLEAAASLIVSYDPEWHDPRALVCEILDICMGPSRSQLARRKSHA